MNLKWKLFLSLGVVSFGLAIILGITSLPSVTDVLTWKEFAFVQSKLGWLCLCFGTAHDLFLGWKSIFVEPSVLCGFFFSGTMVSKPETPNISGKEGTVSDWVPKKDIANFKSDTFL